MHLNRDSLSFFEDGIEVNFPRAKRRQEVKLLRIIHHKITNECTNQ